MLGCEFGPCNDAPAGVSGASGDGLWFSSFRASLADADLDWAYWALNDTQAAAPSRSFGAEEISGVLDTSLSKPASTPVLQALQASQPKMQGP